MKRFAFILFALMPAAGAYPADRFMDLWNYAREHNQEVLAEKLELQALLKGQAAAGTLPDPELEFEVMSITEKSASLKDYSVAVSQMVPGRGKISLEKKRAALTAEAQAEKVALAESRLGAELSSAYWKYRVLIKYAEINEEKLSAMKGIRDTALALVSSNKAGLADLLRIEEGITRTGAERTSLTAESEIEKERLKVLCGGVLPDLALDDERAGIEPEVPERSSVLERLESAPALAVAMKEIEMARLEEEASLKAKNPDLLLKGRYRPNDSQMGGDGSFSLMVGFTLPFLRARSKYDPLMESAKFGRLKSEEVAKYERIKLAGEIDSLLKELVREKELMNSYERLGTQAEAAFKSSLSDYVSGRGDLTALLDTLDSVFEARELAFSARSSFMEKKTRLAFLTGIDDGSGNGSEQKR
ncbi:MAG TPA: TolC family protein [Acidobacteriota bacterium]|nr:TolC family protein [Acidobacteriota bacterium]HNT18090.1 TolC family protein [Acidobacteriota bacterium]HPA27209.1 TolC family protein [Acidobacteriota bacterium]HQO19427.1 TolC family protein [Acidobacteriota bacterium]HQQ46135.1 TolC family protein [Acidobacteriota bacterium]